MRLQEAEASLIADLQDESELIETRLFPTFKLITARHPTLGKLVIVVAKDGSGAIVEVSE